MTKKIILFHINTKINNKRAWKKTKPKNKLVCVYEGETANHLPHGKGIYTKTDGSTYVGIFKKGLRHGHGTFTWSKNAPDGAGMYVGEYKNNKRWEGSIYDKLGKIVYSYLEGEIQNSSSHKDSLKIN